MKRIFSNINSCARVFNLAALGRFSFTQGRIQGGDVVIAFSSQKIGVKQRKE